MRKAALMGMCVVLSGCTGFDKFISDTATLPGENPNAPAGQSLNMRRVQGLSAAEQPILPENGNIWPGPPEPLPTLEDAERERDGLPISDTRPTTGPLLHDGEEMSLGEKESIRKGAPLADAPVLQPSPVETTKGATTPRLRAAAPIVIPNGDGTMTVINPDGTASTVRDGHTITPSH